MRAEMDDALMMTMSSNILTQKELSYQLCDKYSQSWLVGLLYHRKTDTMGIMGNISAARFLLYRQLGYIIVSIRLLKQGRGLYEGPKGGGRGIF